MTIDAPPGIFCGLGLVYTSNKAMKMYESLKDRAKNQFANGQRRRDLREI
jgi:hypothetical protein